MPSFTVCKSISQHLPAVLLVLQSLLFYFKVKISCCLSLGGNDAEMSVLCCFWNGSSISNPPKSRLLTSAWLFPNLAKVILGYKFGCSPHVFLPRSLPCCFLSVLTPSQPSPILVSLAGGKMVMTIMTRLLCVQRGIASRWLKVVDQKYSLQNVVSEKPSVLHHAIFTICLHNKCVLEETGCLIHLSKLLYVSSWNYNAITILI